MCKSAKIEREIKTKTNARTFLSSVECGPSDIEKAKKELNFKPTNIFEAI